MPKTPCRNAQRLPIFVPNIFLENYAYGKKRPLELILGAFASDNYRKVNFLKKITKMFAKPLAQTMKIYYNNNKEEEIIKTERKNYNGRTDGRKD